MSDTSQDTSTQGADTTSGDTPAAGDEFTPITSQDDLNKVISDRLARERAKYADYKDLRAKAGKLDQLENAQKSEAEKVADRIAQADAEVAAVPAKVSDTLRAHLVDLHGIGDEDAELFLTANDPKTLVKQVNGLLRRSNDARKGGNYVPREGATPTSATGGDEREVVSALFGG